VEVLDASYVSATGELFVTLLGRIEVETKLCGGSVEVARVKFVGSELCAFDEQESDSPCRSDVCTTLGFSSEPCIQLTAAYCAAHVEDEACGFLLLTFDRVAGEVATIEMHVTGTPGEIVEIVPPTCMCGAPCAGSVEVLSARVTADQSLLVEAFASAPAAGQKLCVADRQVATIDFASAGCVFAAGSDSPCKADACFADPESEACMFITAEYCLHHASDDAACLLFLPAFEAQIGVLTELTVPVRDLTASVAVEIVPAACQCGSGCPGSDAAIAALEVQGGELLKVSFTMLTNGHFRLCAALQGGAVFDTRVRLACHVL
jgi:hypothetical protein